MKLTKRLNEAYADYYADDIRYVMSECQVSLARWIEKKKISGLVIHFLKWAFLNKQGDLALTKENLLTHKKWLKRMLKMGYSINDTVALPF